MVIPIAYRGTGKRCTHETVRLQSISKKGWPQDVVGCSECKGLMARRTSNGEIILMERAAKCRPANEDRQRRMRFCESCEAPLGTMRLAEFVRRYVSLGKGLCPVCGKHVVRYEYAWGT